MKNSPTFNAPGALAALIKERRFEVSPRVNTPSMLIAPEVQKQVREGLAEIVGALEETDRYVRDSLKEMQPSIVEASTLLNKGVAEDLVQSLRNSAVEHFGSTLREVLPPGAADVVFDHLRSSVYFSLNSLLEGRVTEWTPWLPGDTFLVETEAHRQAFLKGAQEPSDLRKVTATTTNGIYRFSEYGILCGAAQQPGWNEWVDQRSGLTADAELVGEVNKLCDYRAWMFAAFFEPKLLGDTRFTALLQEAAQVQAGPDGSPRLAKLIDGISNEVANQALENGYRSSTRAIRP